MRKIILTVVCTLAVLFLANYFLDFGYLLPYKNPRNPVIVSIANENPVISSDYAISLYERREGVPRGWVVNINGVYYQQSEDGSYFTVNRLRISEQEFYQILFKTIKYEGLQ